MLVGIKELIELLRLLEGIELMTVSGEVELTGESPFRAVSSASRRSFMDCFFRVIGRLPPLHFVFKQIILIM